MATITVEIPDKLAERLDAKAIKLGKSRGWIVERSLEIGLLGIARAKQLALLRGAGLRPQ